MDSAEIQEKMHAYYVAFFRKVRFAQFAHLTIYFDLVMRFIRYNFESEGKYIEIYGVSKSTGKPVKSVKIPINTRWSKEYRKHTLAKFYKLEDWYEKNRLPVTMVSLTSYQNGAYSKRIVGHEVQIDEAFLRLKVCLKKLLDLLRNEYRVGRQLNYIWVMEPHKNGYPHIHLVIFDSFTEEEKDSLKLLWSEKYMVGSYKHGLDFSERNSNEIRSIRNYLLKYLSKTVCSGVNKISWLH